MASTKKKTTPRKTAKKKAPAKKAAKKSPPKKPGRSKLGAFLRGCVFLGLLTGLLGLCGVAGLFVHYGQDLPKIPRREDFKPAQMTRIYARHGELIAELNVTGGKRTVVPMEKIPKHVRDAFMAAEDADFMSHGGIDYLGMVRAFYLAIVYDTGLKGTSTITQQVVKNLILTPERSIARKIREIILARELERTLTKEDILWLYLNELYMGHGVNGVEEAAQLYFGKPAAKLSIAEGATLAGMTQSPERLTPFRHPERTLKRRSYVLKQLFEKGFIKKDAYDEAMKTPIKVTRTSSSRPHLGRAPYFVDLVRRDLLERYGKEAVYQGGLRVHTTLDLKLQTAAERAVETGLGKYTRRKGFYRPTKLLKAGEVRAFVKKQARKTRGKLKRKQVYSAVVSKVDDARELVALKVGDVKAELLLEPRGLILGHDSKTGKERKPTQVFKPGHILRVVVHDAPGDDGVQLVRFEPGPETGVILVDPQTHQLRALVGGTSWHLNQYNHTRSTRQTGSTFKPIVYGAALEKRAITPATVVNDDFVLRGATRYDRDYKPKNSDGKNRGLIRIREGLGASRNSVAVQLFGWIGKGGAPSGRDAQSAEVIKTGIKRVEDFARRLGITGKLTQSVTMALGSSELSVREMVTAYTTLASGGKRHPLRLIERVDRARGGTERFPYRPEQTVDPATAFLIADLMRSVTEGYTDSKGRRRSGTASSVRRLGHPVAGKTGTTNRERDAWFIGFTPRWVAGVWVGFDDNRSLGRKEYGGKVAAPIWLALMKAAHKGLKPLTFQPPSRGVERAHINPKNGKRVPPDTKGAIVEHFLTGTLPPLDNSPEGIDTADTILDQF